MSSRREDTTGRHLYGIVEKRPARPGSAVYLYVGRCSCGEYKTNVCGNTWHAESRVEQHVKDKRPDGKLPEHYNVRYIDVAEFS